MLGGRAVLIAATVIRSVGGMRGLCRFRRHAASFAAVVQARDRAGRRRNRGH